MGKAMMYTAVDPGRTTGYAEFRDGVPLTIGEILFEDVNDWISKQETELWVVEAYIIRPAHLTGGYQHQWDKGEALQVIGAIRGIAAEKGIPVVMQQPSIKPMASKMCGIPYKKGKKAQHMNDAILHGAFYWRKNHGPNR